MIARHCFVVERGCGALGQKHAASFVAALIAAVRSGLPQIELLDRVERMRDPIRIQKCVRNDDRVRAALERRSLDIEKFAHHIFPSVRCSPIIPAKIAAMQTSRSGCALSPNMISR